jgi:hypothetical protein
MLIVRDINNEVLLAIDSNDILEVTYGDGKFMMTNEGVTTEVFIYNYLPSAYTLNTYTSTLFFNNLTFKLIPRPFSTMIVTPKLIRQHKFTKDNLVIEANKDGIMKLNNINVKLWKLNGEEINLTSKVTLIPNDMTKSYTISNNKTYNGINVYVTYENSVLSADLVCAKNKTVIMTYDNELDLYSSGNISFKIYTSDGTHQLRPYNNILFNTNGVLYVYVPFAFDETLKGSALTKVPVTGTVFAPKSSTVFKDSSYIQTFKPITNGQYLQNEISETSTVVTHAYDDKLNNLYIHYNNKGCPIGQPLYFLQ